MSTLLVKSEVIFQNLQSLAGQPNNKRVGTQQIVRKNSTEVKATLGPSTTLLYRIWKWLNKSYWGALTLIPAHAMWTVIAKLQRDQGMSTAFSDEMPQILYRYRQQRTRNLHINNCRLSLSFIMIFAKNFNVLSSFRGIHIIPWL